MRFDFFSPAGPEGKGGEGLAVKLLVAGVLLVHVAWICAHLFMVNAGTVNPWKLGGYGMYTVPFPRALTHLYLFDEQSQRWAEVPRARRAFNSYLFDSRNHLHVFRCRPVSERSLTGFFDENPHLRYRPLSLAISEVGFDRAAAAPKRGIVARVEIAWGGKDKFGYRGTVCDEDFQGVVAYDAPPEATGSTAAPKS